jgi:hypothetical protein
MAMTRWRETHGVETYAGAAAAGVGRASLRALQGQHAQVTQRQAEQHEEREGLAADEQVGEVLVPKWERRKWEPRKWEWP